MLSCNSLPNLVNLIVLASHCYHMLQWSGDSDHKLFSQYKTLHRTYENGSYDVPSINTNALRPTHWSLKDKGNEVRSPDNPIIWLYGKRVYLSNSTKEKKYIMGWCVKGLISCLVREKYIYWLTKYWGLLCNGFVSSGRSLIHPALSTLHIPTLSWEPEKPFLLTLKYVCVRGVI